MIGTIAVLGRKGDTKITWDPTDSASVDKARGEFDALKAKGCTFVADGKTVRAFKPELADLGVEIVAVPRMAGGC